MYLADDGLLCNARRGEKVRDIREPSWGALPPDGWSCRDRDPYIVGDVTVPIAEEYGRRYDTGAVLVVV